MTLIKYIFNTGYISIVQYKKIVIFAKKKNVLNRRRFNLRRKYVNIVLSIKYIFYGVFFIIQLGKGIYY